MVKAVRTIYFATSNKGKVHHLQQSLNIPDVVIEGYPMELPEPRSYDLGEIAKAKVQYAFQSIQKPCIAMDSGFYLDAWPGFPGPYSKFALDTIGIDGLLRLIIGKKRGCHFHNCLAYLDDQMESPLVFDSKENATLTTEPRGELSERAWSDIWRIAVPEGQEQTMAEMTEDGYVSWRKGRKPYSFTTKFAEWLNGS